MSHLLIVIRSIQIFIHIHFIVQLNICYKLYLKLLIIAIWNYIFTTDSFIVISFIQILIHSHHCTAGQHMWCKGENAFFSHICTSLSNYIYDIDSASHSWIKDIGAIKCAIYIHFPIMLLLFIDILRHIKSKLNIQLILSSLATTPG